MILTGDSVGVALKRKVIRQKRHRLVQRYDVRVPDRLQGRVRENGAFFAVKPVKVAPGDKPGYHSMSRPEYQALIKWIADFRHTVADVKAMLEHP